MFSLLPTSVLLPVTSYAAPSPSTKPSPVTVTSLFVNALPSYSFSSVALVITTSLFVISSVPFFVLTMNCAVTSFLAASLTIAVPLISLSALMTSVDLGSLVSRPSTVYVLPSTSNSSVLNPSALCSSPSYFAVVLLASTVISYFVVRSVTVSLPATVLIS